MRKIVTFLTTLILVLCLGVDAPAVRVKLGDVGDDDPHYLWCHKNHRKIIPGEIFKVKSRGQSLINLDIYGKIDLISTSRDHFRWHVDVPNQPLPVLRFTPTMDLLSGLGGYPRMESFLNTAPGFYYLKFVGIDDQNEVTEATQGCLVEVVNQRPDIEFTDINLDTTSNEGDGSFKVKMTIKNNMTVPLMSVPWSMEAFQSDSEGRRVGVRRARKGVQNNVGPLTTFEVTVPIQARYNTYYTLDGWADPENFLGENEEDRVNNQKSKIVYVGPPVSPPPLVTQDLRYSFAQLCGATFSHNMDGIAACSRLGVGDWEDNRWIVPSINPERGVLFQADCQFTRGEANPEAYKDFQLKNGWHIKSVDRPNIIRQGSSDLFEPLRHSGFELITPPVIGSNNPYMKAHIWADPTAFIRVGVRVIIEGPEGTDPYRDGPCDGNCELVGSTCVKRYDPTLSFRCEVDSDCAYGYYCVSEHCRELCCPR